MFRSSIGMFTAGLVKRGYLGEIPCKLYLDDPLPLPQEDIRHHLVHVPEETVKPM
jgi:hypothetical protein